jgi:hypothetical protein
MLLLYQQFILVRENYIMQKMPHSVKGIYTNKTCMIILQFLLTTFEASAINRGSWAVVKIGLSLKSNHDKQV